MNKEDGGFTDWLYGGLDFSMKGDEGIHCYNSLSWTTRVWETLIIGGFSLFEIYWGCCKLDDPKPRHCDQENSNFVLSSRKITHDGVQINCVVTSVKDNNEVAYNRHSWPLLKRLLLVLLCLTFGIEIGYKLTTRSLIYLLNPCHIFTIIQIFLLSANHEKRPKLISTVFRIHFYLLSGALLAMAFPVVSTRLLPFEQSIYWIQHSLLYIIPFYLISLGHPFSLDPLDCFRWPILSIGVGFFYHFFVLQPIGMVTQVNLNNMLCAASSDPFRGSHYRKWATAHQHLLILLHGKLYHLVALILIKCVATLRSLCVAVTLTSWKWTINLCCRSAAACSRYYYVSTNEEHSLDKNRKSLSNYIEDKDK